MICQSRISKLKEAIALLDYDLDDLLNEDLKDELEGEINAINQVIVNLELMEL